MENEKNVLVEEAGNLTEEINHKTSKVAILGIAAVTAAALLLKFRRKISSKIENVMVRKLSKKGYAVLPEIDISEEVVNVATEIAE